MVNVVVALVSLLVVVKSAGVLVDQAEALAKKLGVNDFLIGFTIVAFGTSLPELVSSIFSAIAGHSRLVTSNIIGSNMANLCLILGAIAIFKNYRIKKRDVDLNIPLNLASLAVVWALGAVFGFRLNWAMGVSLVAFFLILVILSKDYNHLESTRKKQVSYNGGYLLGSLLALILGARLCIDGIVGVSENFGISETILGYFFLALGTSLPELATTWVAVKRHEEELGIGSILGSNLFNLLFVMGISSFIRPVDLAGVIPDLGFLTMATVAAYAFAIRGKKYFFSKREGIGLVVIYVLFVLMQIRR